MDENNTRKNLKIRVLAAACVAFMCVSTIAGCGSSAKGGASGAGTEGSITEGTGSGADGADSSGNGGAATEASGAGTGGNLTDAADAGSGSDGQSEAGSGSGTHGQTSAIEQTYFPQMPSGTEDSSIFVQKIDGIGDDFIRGMDVSSLLVEEESGVKYYDAEGTEQDLFKILADAGINCIRVRVWNDPYDAEGHGYGGGNCTAETAATLGARAAAYGMDMCVDFHYSDFWADPNKQMRPKAWNNMRTKDQKQALYDYTVESLHTILDSGARVTMVQIGNEINHGLSGRTSLPDIAKLLASASEAVRAVSEEYGTDIGIAVHYTEIDDAEGIDRIAARLKENGLDYDIFGVSYYPYWHGSMENLTAVLKDISAKYGVKTCVMETAYMYTTEDGDGSGNSVSEGNEVDGYPVSVQGQANCVRDVCAAAFEGGALGVFYWEGAWIPVNPPSGTKQDAWEKYGSGWASSYAAEYDPDDAGRYYGGCSWENQAFFDFEGHVLDSANVFKYLKYGAKADALEVMEIKDVEIKLTPGDELKLPETVDAVYNDPSDHDKLPVHWDEKELNSVDVNATGEYFVTGYVDITGIDGGKQAESGVVAEAKDLDKASADPDKYGIVRNNDGTAKVTAHISVANVNLLKNGSFEEDDRTMWKVVSYAGDDPTDYQEKSADAHDGDWAFHFWSKSDMEFSVEQTITVEKAGIYRADAWMQGGDFNSDAEVYLYVKIGEKEFKSDNVTLDGWVNWKNPEIKDLKVDSGDEVTVGAYVKCKALSWATFDDLSLKME